MISFGKRLAAVRKDRGLSQSALAEALGTSVSVVSRYERNEMAPSVETARRIAEHLDASLAYLLGGGGEEELLGDRDLVRRLRAVQAFDPDERERVYFTLDAVIREIQNRRTYANAN